MTLATMLMLAFNVGACDKKKKKKTTPRERPRRAASVVMSSKGAKLEKCSMSKESRLVTLDLNRDHKRDRWLLLDDKGKKICHEMDTDFDGKRDLAIKYFDDGITRAEIWWDLDYDGVWDQVLYNRPDGTKKRLEVRPYPVKASNKTKGAAWRPTIWKYYRNVKGKGTVIDRVEMDKDRNGYKDYWERYEDGVLKEVSWADAGDTDEKPKHWIEAPEQGQDKGFRGKDEQPKKKKTDKKKGAKKK